MDPPASPARLALAGGYVLDLAAQAVRDPDGRPVGLRPQAFDVLRVLAERRGELVTKEVLFALVWPGLVVTDDSLVQAIGDIRRALGEAGRGLVRTVPRRGYLMELAESAPAGAAEPASPRGRWRFAAAACLAVLLAAFAAWRWSTAPPARVTQPSIAVLPFRAPTPEGEPLARDLAANLVSELGRSADLRVLASQSSFALADQRMPLLEIGQRLRSRYIVGGTVRRDGERLSMAIDLLDSEDGRVVWSSSHDVDRETLAAAQRALVERIAGSLQARVARHEERRALEAAPRSLDVVALTAQGRILLRRYSAEGIREARRLFEQAIERDPGYAPAWVALGQVNNVDIGTRLTGEWDRRRTPEVLSQLERAIALQPGLPLAHLALSEAQGVGGAFDASLASAAQCLRLSPNDAGCLYALGAAELRVGRVAEAVAHLEQARDRNPVAPAFLSAFYGSALWAAGRHEDALRVADECLAVAPHFHRCRVDRVSALAELGRVAEAREEAGRLLQRAPSMTAEEFAGGFAPAARALHTRRLAVARAMAIPAQD
ncbi:winged helix-turn-helix domain-containing protein [Piscinibacter sp. XHJ-5]|uniref:winged helix-turn-helix domain-containing protein n=1 Tax=Piscinibacter sp. XHJ-5 TaxID=3037797 RepID=UPI002452D06A|nr:winged helix-turn-helix domain-containing protein [Piscinibacter sp. XHJ-5]